MTASIMKSFALRRTRCVTSSNPSKARAKRYTTRPWYGGTLSLKARLGVRCVARPALTDERSRAEPESASDVRDVPRRESRVPSPLVLPRTEIVEAKRRPRPPSAVDPVRTSERAAPRAGSRGSSSGSCVTDDEQQRQKPSKRPLNKDLHDYGR